jgi:hypothetical protein
VTQGKRVSVRTDPDGPGDLCGPFEAAKILGIERTRVARYVRTGVMPPQRWTLAGKRKVWLRADIEKLRDERARKAKAAETGE